MREALVDFVADYVLPVILVLMITVMVIAIVAGFGLFVSHAAKSDAALAAEPTKSGRFVFTRIESVTAWSFCLVHDTATGKDYLAAMHGGMVELGAAPAEAK